MSNDPETECTLTGSELSLWREILESALDPKVSYSPTSIDMLADAYSARGDAIRDVLQRMNERGIQ